MNKGFYVLNREIMPPTTLLKWQQCVSPESAVQRTAISIIQRERELFLIELGFLCISFSKLIELRYFFMLQKRCYSFINILQFIQYESLTISFLLVDLKDSEQNLLFSSL
jgi:hypothetical protein